MIALLAAAVLAAGGLDGVFADIEARARAESGDPSEARKNDEKNDLLASRVLALGERALPELTSVARDGARHLKTRLWAVAYASRLQDPAAFPPLRALALDEGLPEALRLSALAALPGQKVGETALRGALTEALGQEALPGALLREALGQAASFGVEEPALLERRAKAMGRKPPPEAASLITALGRSTGLPAARVLLELVRFYRPGSPWRQQALEELRRQRLGLRVLGGAAADPLRKTLGEETRFSRPSVLIILDLLGELPDSGSARVLLRLLDHDDPEIIAEAAEALARLKAPEALAPLRRLAADLHRDERFGPESVRAAARIERALAALQAPGTIGTFRE